MNDAGRTGANEESRLRVVMNAILAPHVVLDSVRDENGTVVDFVFTDANQAACDFNGLSYDELIGIRFLSQHPAAARAGLFGQFVQVVDTGEPLMLENWPYPQDLLGGEERRYDMRAAKIGDGLVHAWHDVTERYNDHAALEDFRLRLQAMLDATHMGIALVSPKTNVVHEANARFLELVGQTTAGVGVSGWLDLIHAGVRQEHEQGLSRLERGAIDHLHARKRHVRPDGTEVWLSISVSPVPTPEGQDRRYVVMLEDVSRECEGELLLQQTTDVLRLANDAAEIGVWSWDYRKGALQWDDRMCEFYDVPEGERESAPYHDFWRLGVHPDDLAEAEERQTRCIEERMPFTDDFRVVGRDGRIRYIHSAGVVEHDDAGHAIRMIGINQDVTLQSELEQQLRTANEELESIARVDALTGVPNRLAGLDRLHDEYARMRRTHSPFSVLVLDVDHFKLINDRYGHGAGDKALQRVASLLKNSLRQTDMLARFGGEEFIAILPDTGSAGASKVAETLRRAVESDASVPGGRLTVSIGVSVARSDDEDEMSAVSRADLRMYEAKEAGRNRVVTWSCSLAS